MAFKENIDNINITADFSDIREDGLYFLNFGKLNGARLLSAWIRHLCYNIAAPPDYPGQTFLIGRDPKGKTPLVTYCFPALKSGADQYFNQLIKIYNKGAAKPFYFFCETSWQFAQTILKEDFEHGQSEFDRDLIFKVMNKAKTNWYGGYYQTGEKQNRYISLCVENNDPFKSVDALLLSGFIENSITVYKPLLENLTIIS